MENSGANGEQIQPEERGALARGLAVRALPFDEYGSPIDLDNQDVRDFIRHGTVSTGVYWGPITTRWAAISTMMEEVFAAGEARGRAAERADVVAFLRSTMPAPRPSSQAAYALRAILDMAEHVERGEHVGAAGGRPTP